MIGFGMDGNVMGGPGNFGDSGGLLGNFSGLPDEDYDPVYDFSLFEPATDTTPRVGNVKNRVGTLMSHPDLSMIDYGMDENTTVPQDAFELFGNMDLQHEIAAHHLNSLVEGYRGLPIDAQSNLRSSARHALGVQSVGKPLMDAYEFGSNVIKGSTGQPEDYAANARAAEALAINPDISTRALIGQVALGTDSPIGLESAETPSTRNVNPYAQGFPLATEEAPVDPTNPYGFRSFKAGLNDITKSLGPFGYTPSNPNYQEPSIELYDPPTLTDPNSTLDFNNPGYQSIFDGVMVDPFDMSNAIASIEPNAFESAFGTGYQGISPDIIGPDFDQGAVSRAGGGELQEALAQRVAETIIAQQAARQVTPQSNRVTIPVSSGPNIVIDVTPPEPRNPVRSRPVRPENVEQRNPSDSPIRIAAKSITKPEAFKRLPKFAQEEIRQGRVPTSGSDAVQDMVRDFLGGQKTVGDSGTRR